MFEQHADSGKAIELDGLFMDMTMDVINYYLYGRSNLNYDVVGGKSNLKVHMIIIISCNSVANTLYK